MELKNAVAVCLISLFSAGLVVLIARSLDLQAASRLEPQLERIVEELQAIRRSGGWVGATDDLAPSGAIADGLMVYYFHGQRCPSCRLVESQAHDLVHSDFATELKDGTLAWKVVDYLKPAGKEFAKNFDVSDPVVVLVRMKNGEMQDWNRLDRVMVLKNDKPAFAKYVRGAIQEMLSAAENDVPGGDVPETPTPDVEPTDIPLPGQGVTD